MKKDADKGLNGLIPRSAGRRILKYLFVLAGCVLFADALVGDKGIPQMLKKRQQSHQLDEAVAAARAENAALRARAAQLKTDPATIEDLARRNLGLIKRGEKVFIIRDARPADAPAGK